MAGPLTGMLLEISELAFDAVLPKHTGSGMDFLIQAQVWKDGSIYNVEQHFLPDDENLEIALRKYVQSCKFLPAGARQTGKISLRLRAKYPISDTYEVSDADYQKFLEGYKKQPNVRNEYHVQQILLDKEDLAKEILNKIWRGESFDVLARRYSIDPWSAIKGGDMGWKSRQDLVDEFQHAVLETRYPGMYPKPVKTNLGWHLIKVSEVRSESLPSREQVAKILYKQAAPMREFLLKIEAK